MRAFAFNIQTAKDVFELGSEDAREWADYYTIRVQPGHTATKSIAFEWPGNKRIENTAPFNIMGDNASFAVGTANAPLTVKLTGYAEKNGKGKVLEEGEIRLSARRPADLVAGTVSSSIVAEDPNTGGGTGGQPGGNTGGGTKPPAATGLLPGLCATRQWPWSTVVNYRGRSLTVRELLIDKWKLKHTREWYNSTYRPDAKLATRSTWNGAREAADAGLDVVATLSAEGDDDWSKGLPTAAQSRELAHQLVDAIGDKRIRVALGNEINTPNYWPGTLKQFVELVLKPMYEVLHAAGYYVIGGSITWDVKAVKEFLAAGAGDYMDGIGFHPYRGSAAALRQMLKDLTAATGDLDVWLTEYNTYLGGNYRTQMDPTDKRGTGGKKREKFKTPAMDADTIISRQRECWNVLKEFKQIRGVGTFIMHSPNWKHMTGPLCMIGDDKKVTKFGEAFADYALGVKE